MNENPETVSIGPTTIGGVSASITAFLGAVVVYLTGDHTAQTLTSVELAGSALLIALVVMGARYLQAHKKIAVFAGLVEASIPVIEEGEKELENITLKNVPAPPEPSNPPNNPPADTVE